MINGIYYQTIMRNEQSGETDFFITPMEPVDYVQDGLVRCHGVIGFYTYRTPIFLNGEYKNGVFYVESEELPEQNEDGMRLILDYIGQEELTDAQKDRILKLGNLFDIVKENDAVKKIEDVKVDNKIAKKIVKKLVLLKSREKVTKFLLKENIPIDRIDFLISKDIGITDIRTSPYSVFALADLDIYHTDLFAVKNCGIHKYSVQRLIGWISDTIRLSKENGNSCISMASLIRSVNARLAKSVYPDTKINAAILNFCLTEIQKKYSIKINDGIPYIYENKIWEEESSILSDIKRIQGNPVPVCRNILPEDIEKKESIMYTVGQKNCFHALEKSGIKVITGPPGSGKTAVIKGIIRMYQQEVGSDIQLAATTGRAAQVLSNATGMNAVTVNKLLDIRPFETAVPGKNINEPIAANLIIVDEVSMLGLELASYLLSAVKNQAILIFVGDKDQLPSVDYGNVLADFIECGLVEVYYLTEVMRQHGTILENSQLINKNIVSLKQDRSFTIRNFDSVEAAADNIEKMHIDLSRVQYLSTVKKDVLGTWNINRISQKDNQGKSIRYGKNIYYIGDRIIMTKTDYDRGYINGDIGIVTDIQERSMIVNFNGKILSLDNQDLFYVDLAYCVTIHKSQGSEFDYIIILLPDSTPGMLTKRILYTAVTRAKKALIIFNINQSMEHAISNKEERKRVSLLACRLKKEIAKENHYE